MNPPEDVDVQSDLKLEVKGEDDDDIEVTPVQICTFHSAGGHSNS